MDRPRLNDAFPGWPSGAGIFSALQNYDVPWKEDNISTQLDLEYHGNVSGEKYISPLVGKLMSGDSLTESERFLLATTIMAVCGVNWGKQWETLSYEYDPIENYSMTEVMSDDETVTEYGHTNTRTDDTTHTKDGTETRTPDLTETTTPDLSEVTTPDLENNNTNSLWGFNSTTAVSADTQNSTSTGTNTVETTGTNTVTQEGTDTMEYDVTETDTGTVTDVESGSDTHTRNYTLTRSGNIGVTTAQQMITSERELWVWNFFHNVVFPDIDRVLTIPIY